LLALGRPYGLIEQPDSSGLVFPDFGSLRMNSQAGQATQKADLHDRPGKTLSVKNKAGEPEAALLI
jgi:hypothetical protein